MSEVTKIKLTSEFKRKCKLPNYLLSGFCYMFSNDLGNGSIQSIDTIDLKKLRIRSSIFNASFIHTLTGLDICISADRDYVNNYSYILLLYVDLMEDDILSEKSNSLNGFVRLAGVITPFSNLKKNKSDIPNIFQLNIDLKCSLLSKNFDNDAVNHVKSTNVTRTDYTNRSSRNNMLLSYKPTEDLLMDDIISREPNHDSFMIDKSGLIKI